MTLPASCAGECCAVNWSAGGGAHVVRKLGLDPRSHVAICERALKVVVEVEHRGYERCGGGLQGRAQRRSHWPLSRRRGRPGAVICPRGTDGSLRARSALAPRRSHRCRLDAKPEPSHFGEIEVRDPVSRHASQTVWANRSGSQGRPSRRSSSSSSRTSSTGRQASTGLVSDGRSCPIERSRLSAGCVTVLRASWSNALRPRCSCSAPRVRKEPGPKPPGSGPSRGSIRSGGHARRHVPVRS